MKWILLALIILMPLAIAQEGSINLLASVEKNGNRTGAVVELDLELVPGTGRVFVETVPLTKVATQISMRFAKQTACKLASANCESIDFFYTIRGFPGVVGGPSAGAAATILSLALLENRPLNSSVAITGTINSGGLIGPVGGLKEKITAAADRNFETVLIPAGTSIRREDENTTINYTALGKELGVDVIEVATISDVAEEFTGSPLEEVTGEFSKSEKYLKTMERIAAELCNRTSTLALRIVPETMSNDSRRLLVNLSDRAQKSAISGEFYAAASYCFRSNVLLQTELAEGQPVDVDSLTRAIDDYESKIHARDITTLTDLQVRMAVDERIDQAREQIIRAGELNSTSNFAFAKERFVSAKTWSLFFNGSDRAFVIDPVRLRKSCSNKLAEAEERYSYLLHFLPQGLALRSDLDDAYQFLGDKDYIRCLYRASRVKADIDSILGLIGSVNATEVLDLKLRVVQEALLRAQSRGVFPIISANYDEYARSLREYDVRSALIFTEYALEFSELDIYFEESKKVKSSEELFMMGPVEGGILGFAFGAAFTVLYIAIMLRNRNPSERQKRPQGKKR
jgi:uncharacterized protein